MHGCLFLRLFLLVFPALSIVHIPGQQITYLAVPLLLLRDAGTYCWVAAAEAAAANSANKQPNFPACT
jgi:hypothetical protein